MTLIETILALGFAFAAATSVSLAFLLIRTKKPKKTLDVTAEDLLHDLTNRGESILRVQVIDPNNLLLRSARH